MAGGGNYNFFTMMHSSRAEKLFLCILYSLKSNMSALNVWKSLSENSNSKISPSNFAPIVLLDRESRLFRAIQDSIIMWLPQLIRKCIHINSVRLFHQIRRDEVFDFSCVFVKDFHIANFVFFFVRKNMAMFV